MRRLGPLALVLLGSGCEWLFGDPPTLGPDGGFPPPPPDARPVADGSPSSCLTAEERWQDCRVDVTGQVVDFTTLADPIAEPWIQITTAWDTIPLFPLGCQPLDDFVVGNADGTFVRADAPCDSPQHPPILLLLVDDAPSAPDLLASTASDLRLTCATTPPEECGLIEMLLTVPRKVVSDDWRAQLEADGMQDATTRGLVLFQFLESDGTPASGVAPTVIDGATERYLMLGTEVRFLAGDRLTLVRADAATTGISGLAIIGTSGDLASIGGLRADGARWAPVGVLNAPGWFFLEDKRANP